MRKKLLFVICIIMLGLMLTATISKAENSVLESTKYLILEEKGYISRIVPETEINEFKQKFSIEPTAVHVYKDVELEEEISEGYIATGMYATFDGVNEKYELSVIGDFNADGQINQIDLNLLIKHVVGLQNFQMQGTNKLSADLSSDGSINQVDITILIRYIMEHELYIPEIIRPSAPSIEVISGNLGKNGWHIGEVKVKITENLDSGIKIGKTIYKITGSKQVAETQIKSEDVITLNENGEYKVTAYSYSEEGARSKIISKTIKITSLPPDLYDEEKAAKEGKEANVTVTTSESGWTNKDVIIKIELDDDVNPNGLYEIEYKKDGEEWQIYNPEEGIVVTENTNIKVRLTDGENNGEPITIKIENIDKQVPEGNLNVIAGKDKVIVNIQAEDNLSGIEGYTYTIGKVGENGEVEWQAPVSSIENNYVFDNLEENTTYKIKVEIKDKAGNKTELEKEVTTWEEGATGQLVQISQGSKKWTAKDVIVTVIAASDQYTTEYSLDGNTWKEFNNIEELTITQNTTIYARASYNRIILEVISLTVSNIDKQEPNANFTISNVTSKGFKATLEAEDDISGIAKIIWYYKAADSENYTQQESNYVVVGSTGQGSKKQNKEYEYDNLAYGTYWVCAQVTDAAGNTFITDTVYIELETITSGNEGIGVTQNNLSWTNQSVTINIESKDNRYTILTSIDGENWISQTEYILSENNTIYCRLTDGINSGTEIEYNVTNIDTQKPEVQITEKEVTSKSFIVGLNIEDNASGLGQIKWYYRKDGESNYTEVIQNYQEINGTNTGELSAEQELKVDSLTSGTYKVHAIVTDVAGNEKQTEEIAITLETITAGANGLTLSKSNENWTNQSVTVNAEILDDRYSIQLSSDEVTWNDEKSLELHSNGTVYARLTDGVNYGEIISTEITNIDKEVVSATIANIDTTSKSFTVRADITDNASGLAKIDWYIKKTDEEEWSLLSQEFKQINGSEAGELRASKENQYDNLTSGSYQVYALITDVAGNKAVVDSNGSREQDPENPDYNPGLGDLPIDTTLVTITEGNDGIEFVSSNENWTNQNITITVGSKDSRYTVLTSTDEQNWTDNATVEYAKNGTVYARLTDGINVGTYTSRQVNNIDKEAASVITDEILNITSKSFTNKLDITDNASGLAKIEIYYKKVEDSDYRLIEKTYQTLNGNIAGEQETSKDILVDNLESGTYKTYAQITDVAGNITKTLEKEVALLSMPAGADTLILIPNNTNWTNQSVTINIESKDNRYTILTSIDGEKWIPQTEYTFSENNTIYCKLTDGINSGTEIEYNVTNIDTQKPEVQIIEKEVTSKSFTAGLNIEDNASGLGKIKWYYKKDEESGYTEVIQNYQEINGTNAGELSAEKELKIDSLTSGTYQVYAIVTDVAGNEKQTEEIAITLETITAGANGLALSKSDENWTNQPVTVNAEILDDRYSVQLSSDEATWNNEESLELPSNGTVYARLTDGVNYGETTTTEITNIDKEVVSATIANIDTTSKSFTVQTDITDNASGLAKIDWYIKKTDEEDWSLLSQEFKQVNGSEAGELRASKENQYDNLTSGSYQVYALITDVAGNKAVVDSNGSKEQDPENPDYNPGPGDLTIDTTLVTITDGRDGIEFVSSNENWTNQNITITVNSKDSRYTVLTSTDEQNWTDSATVECTSNTAVYARLTDGVNVGTYTSRQVNNIDKEAALVTTDEILNITSKSFTNQLDIIDNASGLAKIEIYYKKVEDSNYRLIEKTYQTLNGNIAGEQETSKNILVDNLESGTYKTYAQITDVAGNITKTPEKEVELLSMPAGDDTLSLIPNNTNWTNESITINVENNDDRYNIQISTDGVNWIDGSEITIDKNETIHSRLTDGINYGEAASITITNIDTALPASSVELVNTTSKSMEIKVEAQDLESGIAQITWYYQKEGEAAQSRTVNYKTINGAENGNTNITENQNFDNLVNGTYTVWAQVTDVAGNKITTGTITINLDIITSGVTALTLTPDITYWTNGEVTVNVTNTDSKYGVQTSIDGVNWNSTSSVTTDENITIYARLFDGVNGGEHATYTIANIDKEVPSLGTINSAPGGTSISLSLDVADSQSGIAKINWYYKLTTETEYKVVTNNYTDINGSISGSNSDTLQTTISNLVAGSTYNIYVEVYDVAGNMVTTEDLPIEAITNTAPETPTVTYSSKTTSSITLQAKATDADGDQLTYTLYTSTSSNGTYSQKATAIGNSGSNVSLTASGLSEYTTYYYYVTVTDQIANNESTKGQSVKTYCSGTGHSGTSCPGTTTTSRTCTTCSGKGTVEKTTTLTCGSCGGDGGYYTESTCSKCGGSGSITSSVTCRSCGGAGGTTTTCSSCGGSGQSSGTCYSCQGTGLRPPELKPGTTCGNCGGSGIDYSMCKYCSGRGTQTVKCSSCGGSGTKTTTSSCSSCGGSGTKSSWHSCSSCGGSGTVTSSYNVTCSTCSGNKVEYITTAGCSHGYSTSHYYCTTHSYYGSTSTHCVHGKSSQHDD